MSEAELRGEINKLLDFFTEPDTGEKYLKDLEDDLVNLIQAQKAEWEREARIDENRTYWWHQQKVAERTGISTHALDRIAELSKEQS